MLKTHRFRNNEIYRQLRFRFINKAEFNSILKRMGPLVAKEAEFPYLFIQDSNLPKLTRWFVENDKGKDFLHYSLLKNLELDVDCFNTILDHKRNGIREIEDILRQMNILGIKLNRNTYELLLKSDYDTHKVAKLMRKHEFKPDVELGKLVVQSLVKRKEYEDAFGFIRDCDESHRDQLYESFFNQVKDSNASRFLIYDVYNALEPMGHLDSHIIRGLLKHAFNCKDVNFAMDLLPKYRHQKSLQLDFQKFESLGDANVQRELNAAFNKS